MYIDCIAIGFGLQPFESFRKAAQQQQPIGYGSYCPSPKPTARRLEIRTPLLGLGKNFVQGFFNQKLPKVWKLIGKKGSKNHKIELIHSSSWNAVQKSVRRG